jgi:transposase-like protein
MEKIPNAIYTKELRDEAVKLATESGLSIPEVGRRLSYRLPLQHSRCWSKTDNAGKLKAILSELFRLVQY